MLERYTAGHGSRLTLKPTKSFDKNLALEQAQNKRINLNKIFNITVFNFNPESISFSNNYGWGNAQNNFQRRKTNMTKQFVKSNNKKTFELAGTIYNKGMDMISNLAFSTKTIMQELEELDYMAQEGVLFLVLKPTEQGGKSYGTFCILDFNYDMSNFIYSSNPLKTTFNLTLEKVKD